MKALFICIAAATLAFGCGTKEISQRFVAEPLPATADTLVVKYDAAADQWSIEGGASGFDRRPRYNALDWEGLSRYISDELLDGPSVKKPYTSLVSFVVKADRTMSHANIYRSSSRPELDEAALRAMDSLKFRGWQPALKNGKETDVTIVFPVFFTPRIALTHRLLKDKYIHPLDTIRYVWNNDPSHRPYKVKGFLVDGVFYPEFKPEDKDLILGGKELGSSWIITDSVTKTKYGLGPEDGLIGITTKEYDAHNGRPREVVEEEIARSNPRNPRPPRKVFLWVAQGAERLDSLPAFKGGPFDKFERWSFEHGQSVRNADPKESGIEEITFVVDKDGRVCSPHIVNGLGEAYDNAVLEFLLNCPAWEPAIKNGKPVPVVISCSICFNPLIR